jgi:DNA primase
LFALVQQLLTLNEERRAIADRKNNVLAMAKAIGFDKAQMNRVVRDIEADAGAREEKEAVYATYRRVLGVRGPLSDALMPSVVDARVGRTVTMQAKRIAYVDAMLQAGAA